MITDIYTAMIQCDILVDNHESDLYVPINEITTNIVNCYKFKCNVTRFTNQVTKTLYYDIPFAFNPYWERRGF